MFIAMNRFRVAKGSEAAFEQVWMSRDSHLEKVPGFVEFHLLKGPEAEDHTLYASHTAWENRAVFEAWTKSEAFRAAHSRAGDNKPLYLDHPQFEGFEVRDGRARQGRVIRTDILLSIASAREPVNVRSWMNSGKHVLVLSFSGFDPRRTLTAPDRRFQSLPCATRVLALPKIAKRLGAPVLGLEK